MNAEDFELQEALKFSPGKPVELKQKPGKVYLIAEYDPMMVPPIWLVNNPKPYYPHELKLMSNLFCLVSPKRLVAA